MKKVITAQNAPAAVGPYCHAQLCDNTLYVSGQLGLDPVTCKAHGHSHSHSHEHGEHHHHEHSH